ncbi:uroporphyrinogen-III C-methyltransferase [Xanthomonas sp. A2111]|uniref:Uroporphyrinogen-III C-methyltransferase n=1 Tax=Xanthomonas hawaiiensis TaxID=3003247 RepID=A0ABU2I7L0_9XANT|nr:uroporphyrinogen-III C-methyltransferase [Xanthomonas sp. A2111]MBO9830464.1 uroporphyrinogen-III C-methyltransferase [Xanthomonas sp. A2111]MDS9993367.1 uroporphyrinogen-III C-methyltransferase [Xanthomonas sp. A2111]
MTDEIPITPRRSTRWIWLLLVLATLAALAFAGWRGWDWWQARSARELAQQSDLQQQLQALQQAQDSLRRDQRATAQRLQDAASTNRVLRDEMLGLSQRSALLEANVAKLADSNRHGAQALRLDEVELLLNQGQQRLLLAGDAPGARRAYALASGVLDGIDDPQFLNLRQALLQERTALDALGDGPQARLAAQLDAFAASLDKLPTQLPESAQQPLWQRLLAPLVKIRPSQGGVLAAGSERVAAHDALQLDLTLARAALERGDTRGYRSALAGAGRWLSRLWPESPQLRERRAALRTLANADLRPTIPELGTTLQQLRAMRDARSPS